MLNHMVPTGQMAFQTEYDGSRFVQLDGPPPPTTVAPPPVSAPPPQPPSPPPPSVPKCYRCEASAVLKCVECTKQAGEAVYLCSSTDCFDTLHPVPSIKLRHTTCPWFEEHVPRSEVMCQVHPECQLLHVCLTKGCGEPLVCMMCKTSGAHRGHHVALVADRVKPSKDRLRRLMKSVEDKIEATRGQIASAHARTAELQKGGSSVRRIHADLDALREAFDQRIVALKAELADEVKIQRSLAVKDTVELEGYNDSARALLDDMEQACLTDDSQGAVIIRQSKELYKRMRSLGRLRQVGARSDFELRGLPALEEAMTATSIGFGSKFFVDTATPHPGVRCEEDTATKITGDDWVTLKGRDPLTPENHRWGLTVVAQGDVTDDTGLMVGILPAPDANTRANMSSSFLSELGGWGVSMGGHLFGNWAWQNSRKEFVYMAGCMLEVDFEMATGNVTISCATCGHKHTVGRIDHGGQLSKKLYPAVSLYYANQKVQFVRKQDNVDGDYRS
eukprot:Rhum_TRINITY_DN14551_c10_g1::Rhum_TRINITY_DN14551_c10_g1_i1::g.95888::m.95888